MTADLSNIFIQIPTYIFWKDLNSVILGCNHNFAKAAGYKSPEELIGKTDYELVWGDRCGDIYREGDQEVLAGLHKLNVIEPQLCENSETVDILVTKVPLKDPNGQMIGIIGSYTKLTDYKFSTKVEPKKENIPLAPRQAECLYYLARGMTIKQIADVMDISPKTIEYHLSILKNKFDCFNKSQLIAKALKLDFIKKELLKS